MSRSILHMLSPLKHMSPFDVNMAVDAGFDIVVPHTNVALEEVAGLVQDAMFSRAPKDGVRTTVFIAGKKADIAIDMMKAAQEAFVPPFAVNVFADPAGSFTTGAAMVAVVRKALRDKHETDFSSKRVAIFGGTGVVAFSAAVLAAQEGGHVTLIGYDGKERVAKIAQHMKDLFQVDVAAADGSSAEASGALAREAEVILSAGPAGRRILSADQVSAAKDLLVAADVNAVPPSGIEGVEANDSDKPLARKALAVGALTIGNIKYQTESGLFKQLLKAETPAVLDFRDAYALALTLVG